MRLLALLLCLQAAPLAAAPPRKSRPNAGLFIASIKIEAQNVFDTENPPENKLFYRAANRRARRGRRLPRWRVSDPLC